MATSIHEWWEDEHDQPPIPGVQVVFIDAVKIGMDAVRLMIMNEPGAFVPVRSANGNLTVMWQGSSL